MDSFHSNSYSYEEYSDPTLAYNLKSRISELENLIETYPQRAQAERQRQQDIIESRVPKYEYSFNGESKTTPYPALAARAEAQKRLFGMSKFKQTMMTITGQKKKFSKLWRKAARIDNDELQKQVAEELNKMFR